MKLRVGDIVEFKKYEDLSFGETAMIPKDEFPKYGKVRTTIKDNENNLFLSIEGSEYGFSANSIARIIGHEDNIDINSLNKGDEVLVKATVKTFFDGFIQINQSVSRANVVKIIKRKEPERFIVKDDNYGMYIIGEDTLSYDKSKAKVYTSRNTANEDAADMYLNAWEVLPYGN